LSDYFNIHRFDIYPVTLLYYSFNRIKLSYHCSWSTPVDGWRSFRPNKSPDRTDLHSKGFVKMYMKQETGWQK